ncbi:hypothetical protein PMIN05_002266 [Paraphaeosphaeria minitans]
MPRPPPTTSTPSLHASSTARWRAQSPTKPPQIAQARGRLRDLPVLHAFCVADTAATNTGPITSGCGHTGSVSGPDDAHAAHAAIGPTRPPALCSIQNPRADIPKSPQQALHERAITRSCRATPQAASQSPR